MRHAAILMGAALLCAPVLAMAQAVGETIDVQGWKVHLEKNDDGTKTCAAMWQFDDKSAVGFAADTEQRTFLIISEPEAGLKKNQKYEVKYHVDDAKSKTVMGVATSGEMLVIPISNPDAEFASFGSGKTLYADFGGDNYEEPLEGSRGAIRALGRCIANAP